MTPKFAKAASFLLAVASVSARSTPSAFVGSTAHASTRAFQTSTTLHEKLPIMAEESVMSPKVHGTSEKPVMKNLKWGCDYDTADRICNFNRHYAEHAGYWSTTEYLNEVDKENPTKYYDSVTGKHLFTAPVGRTMEEYLVESGKHGWPSFRDEEVNWDYVRCLSNGECISVTGTHLGHNLPDKSGNRYCINLVCVAGEPADE
mmetsp:Transcript_9478/g.13933  ORF Transcript_9478/g.13933 Transcript_9478/m.13933 type:complete len:203 (+) Transcript_9478:64-672(+)